jgi:hypothetical protein
MNGMKSLRSNVAKGTLALIAVAAMKQAGLVRLFRPFKWNNQAAVSASDSLNGTTLP